jgi:excisionase family DNA binding protein
MEQNDNPGQMILTLLLDEVRRVVRDELSGFRGGLPADPEVSRRKPAPEKRTAPERKRFYTMKEAAVELSLSTKTVRRLIDRGLLRPSKATRLIRISNDELENFARSTM